MARNPAKDGSSLRDSQSVKTPPVSLGINQERSVGDAHNGAFLQWSSHRENPPGVLELSEEAEREFVAFRLDEEIDRGRQRNKHRWRLHREARKLLSSRSILRTVKSGPNKGKVKEHHFSVVECCRHTVTKTGDVQSYLVEVWRSSASGRAFFVNIKRCGSV